MNKYQYKGYTHLPRGLSPGFFQGIVMLEVLISTVVISTGVLAVVFLLAHLIEGNNNIQLYEQADTLISNKVETFKNKMTKEQFDKLSSGKELFKDKQGIEYDLHWNVIATNEKRKKIDIKITWQSQNSSEKIQRHVDLTWQDPLKSLSLATHGVSNGFKYLFTSVASSQQDLVDGLANSTIHEDLAQGHRFSSDTKGRWYVTDQQGKIVLYNQREHLNNRDPKTEFDQKQLMSIQGRVLYSASLDEQFKLKASDKAFCLYPINPRIISNSNWKVADYVCYLGQNWRGKIGLVPTMLIENSLLDTHTVCPSLSREFMGYSFDNNRLSIDGIQESIMRQDYIFSSEKNACAVVFAELNSLIDSLKIAESNLDESTLKKVFIDESNVLSFSGKLSLKSGHVIKDASMVLTSMQHTDEFYQQNSLCRLTSQVPAKDVFYHCALAFPKNYNQGWQGEINGMIKSESEFKEDDTLLGSCDFSSAIDTSSTTTYNLVCQ